MITWVTDAFNNRASVERWGSEAAARASLATLVNCRNCWNCSNCYDCSDCYDCYDCSDCYDCYDCSGCSRCSDCSGCSDCSRIAAAQQPLVVGPTRSDGYQFVMGASRSIHAGCRVFISLAEAREHWESTRGGTPLGQETMLILDYLEAAAALPRLA